jgi:hypothetical protein
MGQRLQLPALNRMSEQLPQDADEGDSRSWTSAPDAALSFDAALHFRGLHEAHTVLARHLGDGHSADGGQRVALEECLHLCAAGGVVGVARGEDVLGEGPHCLTRSGLWRLVFLASSAA